MFTIAYGIIGGLFGLYRVMQLYKAESVESNMDYWTALTNSASVIPWLITIAITLKDVLSWQFLWPVVVTEKICKYIVICRLKKEWGLM